MGNKILYAEDEANWRMTVSTFLKLAGYPVFTAKDGSEAMAIAQGGDLGAIILDLNLGGEDGMELMQFLKANHPAVPIILYTGQEHDQEQVKKFLAAGAHRYMKKGSLRELVKCIEELVPKTRAATTQTGDWKVV
jgi:DNA-binding response OmpR family regulator